MLCRVHEQPCSDARTNEETWEFALSILYPWVDAARPIGSDELTQVMEGALAQAEREHDRAADERRVAQDAANAEMERAVGEQSV